MYVIVPNEGSLVWMNMGRISGVEGPQGPAGPQGEPGLGAIRVPIDNTGTLTQEQLQLILNSDAAVIELEQEIYYPADLREGEMTFSHIGQTDSVIYNKVLTLNTTTGAWTLTSTDLKEDGSAAMIFNNVTYDKALTDATDRANWTKLMDDAINNQVTYPVYVNGKRTWFVRTNDTSQDAYGYWAAGYTSQTLHNHKSATKAMYFQFCTITKAHSSYYYKFFGSTSQKFYAIMNNFWTDTASVTLDSPNKTLKFIQYNSDPGTDSVAKAGGKQGDMSLTFYYDGRGKTIYDQQSSTNKHGYLDGFSTTT